MKGYDVLFMAGIVLLVVTHFVTFSVLAASTSSAETVKQAEAVVEMVEQNPMVRWILLMNNFKILYSVVFFPAITLTVWFGVKRLKLVNENGLWFGSLFIFFGALINVLNDLAMLLGVLLR